MQLGEWPHDFIMSGVFAACRQKQLAWSFERNKTKQKSSRDSKNRRFKISVLPFILELSGFEYEVGDTPV